MSGALFFYGTLCHAPLREVVLGLGHSVCEARLEGYGVFRAGDGDYPVALKGEGAAEGLLVEGLDAEARARADYFELGFGYRLEAVELDVQGRGQVAALAYLPEAPAEPGAPWELDAWAAEWGPIWVEAAREAMEGFADGGAALARRWEMIKQRAATRLRAADAPGARVRADFSSEKDVTIEKARRPYTEYFTLEDHDLRYRRFDGTMSAVVRRAGFVGGDAATVLPYDPDLDAVLVVEQFRTGPLLRGDPRPWTLEPIAGRVDPGESPEDCARREAEEEAGLGIGALFPIANFYPSPGAVTEFVFSYVGLSDLSGRGGEIGGMDGEHEDIRTHLLPFDELMALITSGEVNTGPLILSALWLGQNRQRLRGAS